MLFSLSGFLQSLFSFPRKLRSDKMTNWAGNLTYDAKTHYEPESIEEIQDIVRKASRLKVLGSRHSFSGVANTRYNHISLSKLDDLIEINEQSKTVEVEGGVNYGHLCPLLHKSGYALHNLASLPHISVAGASATGTHGSGINNGNLPSALSSIEFIDADGSLISLDATKDKEQFEGIVVGLGGFGVVTKLSLNIEKTYPVQQYVFQFLPEKELESNFDAIFSSGYSVSIFTDWQTDKFNQIWIKSRSDSANIPDYESEFFGATPAKENLRPVTTSSYQMNDPSLDLSPVNCTEQMGVPGPWHERLPHFKMEFTPSSGEELQSEYFVPYEFGLDAINALRKIKRKIDPLLIVSEIRVVKADDFWMSPSYKQDSMTFHFTWKQDAKHLKQLLPLIEKELAPFKARPHWGKIFTIFPSKFEELYPKINDFKNLLNEYDHQGKFRNSYLKRNLQLT